MDIAQDTNTKRKDEAPDSGDFASLPLRGDLDNIILTAIRKDPLRRYHSVADLSEDISNYLNGLPVTARPNTFAYRTEKFLSRNKISVIASALVVLALLTATIFSLFQSSIARQMQTQAEREMEKSQIEKEKSEKISRFMSKVISYANPNWYSEGAKFGKDARVIDAIIYLSEKIDSEFVSEPDVAAELHHRFTDVIGTNAGNLKPEEQRARTLFHARRALELRKQFYGEKHELVAKDMVYLYWAGGIEPSEKPHYLMKAIQMMRETNPNNLNLPYMLEDYTFYLMMPDTEPKHESYLKAVRPQTDENKYQIGEKYLLESLPVFRLHYKKDNSAIFSAECKLSYALAMQKKWADFDNHYAVCKQFATQLKSEATVKEFQTYIDLIEKVLVANHYK